MGYRTKLPESYFNTKKYDAFGRNTGNLSYATPGLDYSTPIGAWVPRESLKETSEKYSFYSPYSFPYPPNTSVHSLNFDYGGYNQNTNPYFPAYPSYPYFSSSSIPPISSQFTRGGYNNYSYPTYPGAYGNNYPPVYTYPGNYPINGVPYAMTNIGILTQDKKIMNLFRQPISPNQDLYSYYAQDKNGFIIPLNTSEYLDTGDFVKHITGKGGPWKVHNYVNKSWVYF